MTDHTPDVADLPAELEQLRELAGDVARFASARAELWRVRRALETAARAWLDAAGTATDRNHRRQRLLEVVGTAGDEPTAKGRSDELARKFVSAVRWSTPRAGRVFRGEVRGVGVVRDPLPAGRNGDPGGEPETKQDTAEQGRVERVLVELRPIGTAGPHKVDPCFTPARNDGGLQASLEAAVTAGLGWVTAHNDWLDVPETDRWQARVYLGGYPLPVDATSDWHNRKVTGPSLGLAVALATVAAFLPAWACRDAPRVVATGMCDPDGTVRPVRGTEIKAARTTKLPERRFVYPKSSEEEFPPQQRETPVAELDQAITIAFPLITPLVPRKALARPLGTLRDIVPAKWQGTLPTFLVPPRVKAVSSDGTGEQPLVEVLAASGPLVALTGEGGAGKTTALLSVYDHVFREQVPPALRLAPCYVNVADAKDGDDPVFIVDPRRVLAELLEVMDAELDDLAHRPGLLLLLDGANELPDPRLLFASDGPVMPALKSLIEDSPSRIVLAGRPHTHGRGPLGDALEGFDPLELARISTSSAITYLGQVAGLKEPAAREALETVARSGGDLTVSPMLLLLLARIIVSTEQLPTDATRGEIFREALAGWLAHELRPGKWDPPWAHLKWDEVAHTAWNALDADISEGVAENLASAAGTRTPVLPALWAILGELARQAIDEGPTVTRRQVEATLTRLLGASDPSPRAFCDDWLRNCPVLTLDATYLRFVHDSFAEYYAAERFAGTQQLAPLEHKWVDVLALQTSIDSTTLDRLAELLSTHADLSVRATVVEALGQSDAPGARSALVGALSTDPAQLVRALAAVSLAGAVSPDVLNALAQGLSDPNSGVRYGVGVALRTGISHPEVLNVVVGALSDPSEHAREEACRTLDLVGTRNPTALKALAATLSDPAAIVRVRAASVLVKTEHPAAAAASDILVAALFDTSSHVRQQAVMGLAGTTYPAALDALKAAVRTDPDPDVRKQAAEALEESRDALARRGHRSGRQLDLPAGL